MPPGRPRGFDLEQALDVALDLFWRHGYEGTSVAALAQGMGVCVPSLYAAFGNKQALFAKVVDRYIEKPASYLLKALQEPTARRVAERALRGAIDMVMQPRNADGCLLVQGALVTGPAADAVRKELNLRRSRAEASVCQRFRRARAERDLPPDVDPEQLARYLMTIIWGLSVQAAGGAGRAELEQVADLTLKCWPGSSEASPTD